LARPDRGADADERMDVMPALLEDLAEVVDLQQRLRRAVDRRELEVRGLLARELLGLVLVVATRTVTGCGLGHLGLLGPAAVIGERATIGEDAARDLGTEARQEAGDRVETPLVLA